MRAARWWTLRGEDGLPHYPASAVELLFNVVAGGTLVLLARRGLLRGDLFHLYLVAYGLFRLAHELVRDTPRWPGTPVSGYMVLAAGCVALGVWRWRGRRRVLAPRPVNFPT